MLGIRSPAFAADSTLGQLAKQLRLAGFDTLLDHQPPDSRRLARLAGGERIVLTRSTKVQKELVSRPHIFIRHDQPQMQLKQVIATLGLHREDVRPPGPLQPMQPDPGNHCQGGCCGGRPRICVAASQQL